ncbi:MAG: hypothetical protein SGJ10_00890 [Bacteroidota bacterium]|nr:hypothetical protein [Bacteroidota bacterium]
MKNLKFLFVMAFAASTVMFSCKSGKKDGDANAAYLKNWDSLKTVLAGFDADLVKMKDDMKKMNDEKMSCKPQKGKEKQCDSLKQSCSEITKNMDSLYKAYKEAVAKSDTKSADLKTMKEKADKGDKEVTAEKVQAAYDEAAAELGSAISMFNPKDENSAFKTEWKHCDENCNACEGICEGEETEKKKDK